MVGTFALPPASTNTSQLIPRGFEHLRWMGPSVAAYPSTAREASLSICQRARRMISARRVLWRLDPATDDLASIEAVGWGIAVPVSTFDPFGGVFSCDPPITADRPLEAEDVASDGEAAVEYGLRADSSGGDGAAEEPNDWLAAELCAVMGGGALGEHAGADVEHRPGHRWGCRPRR